MENVRKETLRQFIASNILFWETYNEKGNIGVDKTLKIELMMIYLLMHKDDVARADIDFSIKKLVETQNYTLQENGISFEEQDITFEELYKNIDEIENYRKEKMKRIEGSSGNAKRLLQETRNILKSKPNHSLFKIILENQAEINKKNLTSTIFTLIKGESSSSLSLKEILLLYSIVSLYPISSYAKEDEIKKENLPLATENLQIRKLEFHEKLLQSLIKEKQLLEIQLESLEVQSEGIALRGKKMAERKIEFDELLKKKREAISQLEEQINKIKSANDVSNQVFIEVIWSSLINGTFDPSTQGERSLITLYTLKESEIANWLSISLKKLANFINNDEVLKELDSIKLIKEHKGETS